MSQTSSERSVRQNTNRNEFSTWWNCLIQADNLWLMEDCDSQEAISWSSRERSSVKGSYISFMLYVYYFTRAAEVETGWFMPVCGKLDEWIMIRRSVCFVWDSQTWKADVSIVLFRSVFTFVLCAFNLEECWNFIVHVKCKVSDTSSNDVFVETWKAPIFQHTSICSIVFVKLTELGPFLLLLSWSVQIKFNCFINASICFSYSFIHLFMNKVPV